MFPTCALPIRWGKILVGDFKMHWYCMVFMLWYGNRNHSFKPHTVVVHSLRHEPKLMTTSIEFKFSWSFILPYTFDLGVTNHCCEAFHGCMCKFLTSVVTIVGGHPPFMAMLRKLIHYGTLSLFCAMIYKLDLVVHALLLVGRKHLTYNTCFIPLLTKF